MKLKCESYLINILNTENYNIVNETAELYNAERLKEYCNWFYRRHCNVDNESSAFLSHQNE